MCVKTIDAVVAGVSGLDITPKFITPRVDSIADILVPSKTLNMGPVDIHTGGCVSNTGLALAKFGNKVRLMTKIGNDDFGELILEEYQRYTSTESVKATSGAGTSYSIIIAPEGIDRMFMFYPGANDTFGPNDLDYETISHARLFHFGYPQALKKMYINDGAEQEELLRRVRDLDVTISMDTCGVDAFSEVGRADWVSILKRTLPYVDIFVPSAEELCFMLDRERFDSWVARAKGADLASVLTPEDVIPLAEQALSMGTRMIMIKCGSRGIYFAAGDDASMENMSGDLGRSLKKWAGMRHFEPTFIQTKILSGTGAGDTCIAAFLTCLLRGYDLKHSLKLAAAAGAVCLESYDALGALTTIEDLQARIDAGWQQRSI